MCGIVGIIGTNNVNQEIYDALLVLQHRGQDSAGILTEDNRIFKLRKANGLVTEVFQEQHMLRLSGNKGIGHVRYPTAGTSSVLEAQPFVVNYPYGLALVHNGNLTNTEALKEYLLNTAHRHINTTSDSECLLNILSFHLEQIKKPKLEAEDIFEVISKTHKNIEGAYVCIATISGHGMVAFRDPFGIRPLVLGKKETKDGNGNIITSYIFASETVALDISRYLFVRDIEPGEAIYITDDGKLYSKQCADKPQLKPCIFEYVYFARPDSFMNGVSVYAARVNMGIKLSNKIAKEWSTEDVNSIDVVIPIPETSCDIALQIANALKKPYRQGFVKNRYVGRTFIMPGQEKRKNSVRKKLNTISLEFKDKNVLLVDDSIVRGTTSKQIIQMARDAGAKKVYLASAAPAIYYPNIYGIDMPTSKELIAYQKNFSEITKEINVDKLIYQDLSDLEEAVRQENPSIEEFENSVFTGKYITGNVDQEYFTKLSANRNDSNKK